MPRFEARIAQAELRAGPDRVEHEVRQLAVGPLDGFVAIAAFESSVELWSPTQRRCLASLETILDFGGQRLALAQVSDEPVVVAGAWNRHGICGYTADGLQLWQREDLVKVQRLAWAGAGDLISACFDEGPMALLDAATGETRGRIRAVRGFEQSRFGSVAAAEFSDRLAMLDTGAPIGAPASPWRSESPDGRARKRLSSSQAVTRRLRTGAIAWLWMRSRHRSRAGCLLVVEQPPST